MADLIVNNAEGNQTNSTISGRRSSFTTIEGGSQISLYPLYGGYSYDSGDDNVVTFPVSPSDIMFTESSDPQTIKLINWGELPVGMNRKLATWSFESFFPVRINTATYSSSSQQGYVTDRKYKYWFDISDGEKEPYAYYCDKLLNWKNSQTPLVFFFDTWGSYYNCQIKDFKYGRKDAIGNVFYQIEFQEYKEYTKFDSSSVSTDYSSDTYYPAEGENILQICKKIYGDSNKYQYFMNLNGMKNPLDIVVGQAYKVR